MSVQNRFLRKKDCGFAKKNKFAPNVLKKSNESRGEMQETIIKKNLTQEQEEKIWKAKHFSQRFVALKEAQVNSKDEWQSLWETKLKELTDKEGGMKHG